MSPASALVSSTGFTLTVIGSNFVNNAVIKWNNSPRTTTFVSETQLRATIPNTDIAATGTASITVDNPAPGGGASNAINFTISQTCSYAITPTNQTFAAAGGTGIVNVTSPAGCNWTAVSNDSWLVINSGTPGNGDGIVNFTVSANPGSSQRTGTLTVAGQNFTVNQAGTNCSYSLAPTGQNFTANGGNGSVSITTTNGCNWTATTNDFWVSITSGASGSGNGTVNYTVAENTNVGQRSGAIIINGQNFTITQDGAAQPTELTLIAFTATAYDNGVLLKWRTGFEVNNLGFNIYREQNGQRTRVNPDVIAGSALFAGAEIALTAGRGYQWRDTKPATADTRYFMEELELSGNSRTYGAFAVDMSGVGKQLVLPNEADSVLISDLGNTNRQPTSLQTGATATLSSAKSFLSATQGNLASTRAAKIGVRSEGWYRLTQPELSTVGFSTNIDPRNLQLFVDGREVPILVTGEQDGKFDAEDAVEFYGLGLDTPATNTRIFWLAVGSSPGLRIKQFKGDGAISSAASFALTAERKDRTIYFAALKNGDAENFFGPVIASQPVTQTLSLAHLAANTANDVILEVRVQGITQQRHRIRVELNEKLAGEIEYLNQSQGTGKFTVPQSSLREGQNTVRLLALGGSADVSLLDTIRLTYQHTYTADNDSLKLLVAGKEQTSIEGFSSKQIRVFDVTDASAPQELIASIKEQKSGFSASFTPTENGERKILAFMQEKRPASLSLNIESNLRESDGADLLIITKREFIDSFKPLAAFRQNQGIKSSIVDIEDIYDEFSFGQKSPQAVRDFLSFAKSNWKTAPHYLIFAADASVDPKNYLGYGEFDFVPTKFIDTDYMETASDDWFSDFNNDSIADIATGRLPARTAEEAATMVAKILRYESGAKSDTALFVADRNDGYDFEAAAEKLRSLLPSDVKPETIKRSQADDATARAKLLEAINRGQKLVSYSGHGSIDVWRGNLLQTLDAADLTNQKLSLFLMMNCLNGYFQDTADDSLAEGLMKASRGGAVAVWASSGLTSPNEQVAMNQELFRQLFNTTIRRVTLGEAVLKAKSSTSNTDIRRTWTLFGDPSIQIR